MKYYYLRSLDSYTPVFLCYFMANGWDMEKDRYKESFLHSWVLYLTELQ